MVQLYELKGSVKNWCYLFFLFSVCACVCADEPEPVQKIQWYTNYESAVNEARNTGKPLLLFFTGSDWCGWCGKLNQDVFLSPDFSKRVQDRFVFMVIDFPLYTPLNPQTAAQNRELQKKLNVRSFPSVILLEDQHLQPIGYTGYRSGGSHAYADHLIRIVEEYNRYKENMTALDSPTLLRTLDSAHLRSLHEKAKELGFQSDCNRLIKAGLMTAEPLYFLIERYRFLADEGQIHDPETVSLRQKILKNDPKNANKAHYQIAIIDFEAYSEEMDKESYSPDLAVAPLVEYIQTHGLEDSSNLWRLQMIISQVYLDKNRNPEALRYAKEAYENAPPLSKPEIAIAIKNIEKNL